MTRVLPESNPVDILHAEPTEIWETCDKRQVLVKDMQTSHIVSVIKLLERRAAAMIADLKLTTIAPQHMAATTFGIYNNLVKEFNKRLAHNKRLAQTIFAPPLPPPTQLDFKSPPEEKPTRIFSLD